VAERWRDLAGAIGVLETGERNAITDVAGVRVGHSQAGSGEPTGVTVVAPPALPAQAGVAVLNGTGELTGKLEVEELGVIGTPVHLCGTLALGVVYDAAMRAAGGGPDRVLIPVVGECDDSWRADSRTITAVDVDAAVSALGQEVAEGSVGAGSGMMCFDYPGGIGTASRRVGSHHIGVLLLCNFGEREYLDLLGTRLDPVEEKRAPQGSCIAVCATDAPLSVHELRRLALRPLLGLARVGSWGANGSGEIGLAFGPGDGRGVGHDEIDRYFAAAYEAAHEAVLNCLVAARPGQLRDGSMQDAFPVELVRRLASER
jgi:D-aminopeptidase